MPDLEPSALVLTDDVGTDPQALAVVVLLEGMHQLVRSHQAGWHEGPGSLVPASTWFAAARRLSDDLLRPAADSDGRVQPARLTPRAQVVADALYGGGAAHPLPDRAPWQGGLLVVLGCGRSGT
ncbi:MAG: hypothetical protein M3P04_07125, partial [Actinomycetota bacterium]|nr:hypothetical protein [Actinomycetota bacterium]